MPLKFYIVKMEQRPTGEGPWREPLVILPFVGSLPFKDPLLPYLRQVTCNEAGDMSLVACEGGLAPEMCDGTVVREVAPSDMESEISTWPRRLKFTMTWFGDNDIRYVPEPMTLQEESDKWRGLTTVEV